MPLRATKGSAPRSNRPRGPPHRGHAQHLITWGNRFASQNYGDVYDRRFREAEAMHGPMLQDWQARAAAQQRAAELEFSRAWEAYKYGQDWNQERELALAGLI
jgi:hypothetical protein